MDDDDDDVVLGVAVTMTGRRRSDGRTKDVAVGVHAAARAATAAVVRVIRFFSPVNRILRQLVR